MITNKKLTFRVTKNFVLLATIVFTLNLILFAGIAVGQDTVTGAFQGDVSNNQTGDPISGALIEITSEQTGVVYTRTTDSKGRFYQGLLPPGFYRISVSAPGLQPRLLRREIKVSVTGDIVPVPVTLDPESPTSPTVQPSQAVLEETDDIRVEINTTDARRDGSFKDETITKVPLGSTTITRTFDELALLLPGVAPPPQTVGDVSGPGVGAGVGSAGQFAVNGLRSRGNNFTVDGSDNNDEDVGVRRQGFVALTSQPVESVQEFQITTLLAPAQFGRNLGAQVNIVSKAGGNELNGTVYGFFNSNRLNARNFFDTTNGNDTFALRSLSGQSVLLDGQPLMVRNNSGREDSFTFGQAGGTVGGAIIENKLFYFLSGEYQKINANQEKNFVVPTIEERGAFRTGTTGISIDFFTNQILPTPLYPANERSNLMFSLFPFPNNPDGIYGENTFTRILPASGRGVIFSGRLDHNFEFGGKPQSITGRYNFTDDEKNIPAVGEAIFATVLSKDRTQNLSLFYNSLLNRVNSDNSLNNQIRFSIGHSRLKFDEVRDTEFLMPSDELTDTPFLLNVPAIFNVTLPQNNGQARFTSIYPRAPGPLSTESLIGPIGQVIINGFSPLGVDVYNFPQTRVNRTYQLADELTWRVGKHSLVFGTDLRRTDLNSDLPRNSRPLISFNGLPRLVPRIGNQPCSNGGIPNTNFCIPFPAGNPGNIIRAEDLAGLGGASNATQTFNLGKSGSKANLRYYQLNFYAQDTWRIFPELSFSYGLRYEYNTPVKEVDRLIEETFSDERLELFPILKRLVNNRTQLYKPDYNNFAPRIGVAYSRNFFGGNRLSVFRSGYGIFYDQILGAVANQSRNVFPTFLTFNFAAFGFSDSILTIFNPANFSIFTQGNSIRVRQPGTINTYNNNALTSRGLTLEKVLDNFFFAFGNSLNVTLPAEKLKMPMAHHYSFTFEQQLNTNLTVSVGYVGTSGNNLLRFATPNLGSSLTVIPANMLTPSASAPPFPQFTGNLYIPRRPLDGFDSDGNVDSPGIINQIETTASSTYNSLQTQLRGRFTNSLNFQLSYTLSKVTDDVSDVFDLAGAYVLPQNSLAFEGERAPANFDVRHRWTYQAVYNISQLKTNSFLRVLTNNLQFATTGKFHSGQPFTVNSTIDINLDGNLTDRLDTMQGLEITGDGRQPVRLTMDNPFSLLAPFGTDGSVKRNSFRAGSVLELDLSVIKQFAIKDNRLSFRTDILNFINRANFGIPARLLEAPGFGRATGTVTPARRIQISVKYDF